PVSILIESHDLTRKRHSQRHEQEKDAHDPCQFSWKLVGSKQEDLHHMDEHNRDHEIRAPAVQRSYEPTQGNAMIESLQAVPCFSGRRHVDQSQQYAGHELQHETRERSAAEDIKPACGLTWN